MKFTPKNVFVTVGSTSFDELVQFIIEPETVNQLKRLGCKKITIQSGKYVINEDYISGIELISYKYADSLTGDILDADLVIGHAGAGTCIEVLRHRKRLLVVTNDSLMNRHQDELADKLSEERYLVKTKLRDFGHGLMRICKKDLQLREFPAASESKFETIFNKALMKAKVS